MEQKRVDIRSLLGKRKCICCKTPFKMRGKAYFTTCYYHWKKHGRNIASGFKEHAQRKLKEAQ